MNGLHGCSARTALTAAAETGRRDRSVGRRSRHACACAALLVLLTISGLPVGAEEPASVLSATTTGHATPAAFLAPPDDLASRIRIPEGTEPLDDTLLCGVDVFANGGPGDYVCVLDRSKSPLPLRDAVYAAMRFMRLTPAVVDGEPQRVWMPFSVHFLRVEGKDSVTVRRNLGLQTAIYGTDYVAPQRLQRTDDRVFQRCTSGTLLWVRDRVDAAGEPGPDVQVLGNGTDRCKHYLRRMFLKEQFIPAVHDGHRVPAFYAELFYVARPD